uniref:Myosin_tail_1 domain-containing protein n=1 Tax=Macrostomum lignano TaxID=282301 RepID=A0A1I8FLH5_9PLAT
NGLAAAERRHRLRRWRRRYSRRRQCWSRRRRGANGDELDRLRAKEQALSAEISRLREAESKAKLGLMEAETSLHNLRQEKSRLEAQLNSLRQAEDESQRLHQEPRRGLGEASRRRTAGRAAAPQLDDERAALRNAESTLKALTAEKEAAMLELEDLRAQLASTLRSVRSFCPATRPRRAIFNRSCAPWPRSGSAQRAGEAEIAAGRTPDRRAGGGASESEGAIRCSGGGSTRNWRIDQRTKRAGARNTTRIAASLELYKTELDELKKESAKEAEALKAEKDSLAAEAAKLRSSAKATEDELQAREVGAQRFANSEN